MACVGFKVDGRPAEDVIGLSRLVESAGLDEMWVCEDLGLAGGIAQVTAALSATSRLTVGLGIAPAAVRNPMYLAMELAAVARISGGRLHAGIGHGEPHWLTQVGQRPRSLMACLSEVSGTVRDLLDGREVTFAGEHVHLDAVRLQHAPPTPTPLSLGVRGPKGIALAADLGLGVILAEGSTPDYVARVRRIVGPRARITVFVWSNVDVDDAIGSSEALRSTVEGALRNPSLASQLGPLYEADCDLDAIRRLTVSGDAEACRAAIDALGEAGADAVVLQPIHGHEEEQLERLADVVALPGISPAAVS